MVWILKGDLEEELKKNLALDLTLSRQRMNTQKELQRPYSYAAEAQSSANTKNNLTDQTDRQVENPSSTDSTRTRSGHVSDCPGRFM